MEVASLAAWKAAPRPRNLAGYVNNMEVAFAASLMVVRKVVKVVATVAVTVVANVVNFPSVKSGLNAMAFVQNMRKISQRRQQQQQQMRLSLILIIRQPPRPWHHHHHHRHRTQSIIR
jgi:hypothetical protein